MRNLLYRCDNMVYNNKKKRYYRCNNSIYRYIDNKKLCWCHYNKLTRDSIIIIQKCYRGYKSRRYLKIYKNLPDDIQLKIKYNISKEHYYKLHCKNIYNVLNKRYLSFKNKFIELKQYYLDIIYVPDCLFIDYFNKHIFPVYRLYNKYFEIITITHNSNMLFEARCLHFLSYKIITKISQIAQNYFYNINDNYNNSSNSVDNLDCKDSDIKMYNKLKYGLFIINSLSEKFEDL